MSDSIYLPVSLGEAIDKLTILDIKLARITDSRRADVLTEYTILYDKLKQHIDTYKYLYLSMKKVNTLIWDLMDELRDGTIDDTTYLVLCKRTVDLNDARFRIKNKINTVCNSDLKEQKGYKLTYIRIVIKDTCLSAHEFVTPILYLSYFHDKIVIQTPYSTVLHEKFKGDSSIVFANQLDHTVYDKTFIFTAAHYSRSEVLDILGITETALEQLI